MSRRGAVTVASLHTMSPARAHQELAERPEHGDVIISRPSPPNSGFGISQHPGAVQLSVSRKKAASELVRGFAQRHRVDVWERHGNTYSLAGSYRRNA